MRPAKLTPFLIAAIIQIEAAIEAGPDSKFDSSIFLNASTSKGYSMLKLLKTSARFVFLLR